MLDAWYFLEFQHSIVETAQGRDLETLQEESIEIGIFHVVPTTLLRHTSEFGAG